MLEEDGEEGMVRFNIDGSEEETELDPHSWTHTLLMFDHMKEAWDFYNRVISYYALRGLSRRMRGLQTPRDNGSVVRG